MEKSYSSDKISTSEHETIIENTLLYFGLFLYDRNHNKTPPLFLISLYLFYYNFNPLITTNYFRVLYTFTNKSNTKY